MIRDKKSLLPSYKQNKFINTIKPYYEESVYLKKNIRLSNIGQY